jgi:hypothetical protein
VLHHGCKCEFGCEKSRVIREAERASDLDSFHLHHAIPYAILVLRRFHIDVSTDVVKLVGQDARTPSMSLWYYTADQTSTYSSKCGEPFASTSRHSFMCCVYDLEIKYEACSVLISVEWI